MILLYLCKWNINILKCQQLKVILTFTKPYSSISALDLRIMIINPVPFCLITLQFHFLTISYKFNSSIFQLIIMSSVHFTEGGCTKDTKASLVTLFLSVSLLQFYNLFTIETCSYLCRLVLVTMCHYYSTSLSVDPLFRKKNCIGISKTLVHVPQHLH